MDCKPVLLARPTTSNPPPRNAGLTSLTYLPVTVNPNYPPPFSHCPPLTAVQQIGGTIGCFSYIYYWNPRYMRHVAVFAPNPVPPEYRLEMATWAAVPYAVAFFWFGWVAKITSFERPCS